MPIWNWNKLLETGDLSYLMRKPDISKVDEDYKIRFYSLYDEYLKEFGLSKKYGEYLDLMKKYAMKLCELIHTGDRFKETEADVIEAKMKSIMSSEKGLPFNQAMVLVNKYFGFICNPRKLTVYEYYSAIKMMNNG